MKLSPIALLCAPIAIVLPGCIQSHRPVAVYTTPVAVPAATSERPVVRVYPGTPPPVVVTPPSTPPPGVASADVTLAESVSQLLKGDVSLADASSNVQAIVDHGVVTLRGRVPTDHDRDEIVQRISQLPGVVRVHDELGVELR
jgi:BON domain